VIERLIQIVDGVIERLIQMSLFTEEYESTSD